MKTLCFLAKKSGKFLLKSPYKPYHSVGYLSFRTMLGYLASSVELQAYDNKWEGDRSLLVFRFHVTGSDFLLGTEINDDSHCHPMFQTGVSQYSRSCVSEEFFWGQVPNSHLLPLLSHNSPVV